MGQAIVIEKWAENLDEVTVNEWLFAEGDAVQAGASLCEIITDKATFEYELDADGVLIRTFCKAKSVVPIGYTIAFIGQAGETPPAGIEEANARLLSEHQARAALDLNLDLEAAAPAARPAPERRVRATPAARRVARESGVALEAVAQWVSEDRVLSDADVQAYVGAHPNSP